MKGLVLPRSQFIDYIVVPLLELPECGLDDLLEYLDVLLGVGEGLIVCIFILVQSLDTQPKVLLQVIEHLFRLLFVLLTL